MLSHPEDTGSVFLGALWSVRSSDLGSAGSLGGGMAIWDKKLSLSLGTTLSLSCDAQLWCYMGSPPYRVGAGG